MPNLNKYQLFYWLQLAVVLILGGYVIFFGTWKIQTNILSLLPSVAHQENISKAENALFANQDKQIVVAISGSQAIAAYHILQQQLLTLPSVSQSTLEPPSIHDISQFYQAYKDNVISQKYLANIENPTVITNIIATQLTQLSNPFVSETIAFAPRLNLAELLNFEFNKLNRFEKSQGIVSLQYQQKRYFISSYLVDVDSFSLKQSQKAATQIQQLFSQIVNEYDVELIFSGILFHTAQSSLQAEYEISTFGLLSLIAIILLIIYVFRSILPLFIALLVMVLASFYGLTAVLLLFNEMHLLTLVFSVTLIGIVIDYCFHSFVYVQSAGNGGPAKKNTGPFISSAVFKPLIIGFLTTSLGYFALMFSPMALLSQMAVFMVFGLLGALLCVTCFLPHVKLVSTIQIKDNILTASERVKFILVKVQSIRKYVFVIAASLIVGGLMVADIGFNDDIRLLNSSPNYLLKNEQTMAILLGYQQSQKIIIRAKSKQALLERQENVIERLTNTQKDIKINSIAGLLPSLAQQKANYNLLQLADSHGVFKAGLNMTGLNNAITEFTPLTFSAFSNGALKPLALLYTNEYQTTNSDGVSSTEYALWLEITATKLNHGNLDWIASQDDVSIFDKASAVSQALEVYRKGVFNLLLIAFILAGLIIITRYKLKNGLYSFSAIGLSALGALMLSQLVLGHLNIFNLLAVLLTLALAIDYVVFFQEHGLKSRTLIAITLSAISSALVFGVLAFSQTPAVQSFGLTVMFGIILIFVLAPLTTNSKLLTDKYNGNIDEQ